MQRAFKYLLALKTSVPLVVLFRVVRTGAQGDEVLA